MVYLKRFFSDYARSSIDGDSERIASFYAEEFTLSGPEGSMTFKNDRSFLLWIGRVMDFNKAHGMKRLEVVSAATKNKGKDELTVDVRWRAVFLKEGKEIPSEFNITYVLDISCKAPLIKAYLSHEDQEEKMREMGVL